MESAYFQLPWMVMLNPASTSLKWIKHRLVAAVAGHSLRPACRQGEKSGDDMIKVVLLVFRRKHVRGHEIREGLQSSVLSKPKQSSAKDSSWSVDLRSLRPFLSSTYFKNLKIGRKRWGIGGCRFEQNTEVSYYLRFYCRKQQCNNKNNVAAFKIQYINPKPLKSFIYSVRKVIDFYVSCHYRLGAFAAYRGEISFFYSLVIL